ncbi:MAG: hypothetical protein KDL10_11495, partial [Kiritimatiellae bacterium]|nr:hypothetical protein [Kiritimatiellia bacterium]
MEFPPFSLQRLLDTVFAIDEKQKIGVMIDLPDPQRVGHSRLLGDASLTIQKIAHDVFYRGLHNLAGQDARILPGAFVAYAITGGSNLDLPDEAWDAEGEKLSLEKQFYPAHDIILCISTFSA